ncbi:uncharacterized protein [Cherax quadricarinatus]|uniref:uncharacterized protein n=1 Tax=Cherax quadricarinatus TaxID=27406 RepID=UPI00387E9339
MLAGLLGLAVVMVTTADVSQLNHDVKSLSPSELEDGLDAIRRQERLVAIYTTTSVKRLATTTITAVSTCVTITANAVACNGRKKRTLFKNLSSWKDLEEDSRRELTGSKSEAEYEEEVYPQSGGSRQVVNNRDGKKFTIWSTYVSTLTLTSTSYLAGTTVSVTALCIAPGLTNGCFGK